MVEKHAEFKAIEIQFLSRLPVSSFTSKFVNHIHAIKDSDLRVSRGDQNFRSIVRGKLFRNDNHYQCQRKQN